MVSPQAIISHSQAVSCQLSQGSQGSTVSPLDCSARFVVFHQNHSPSTPSILVLRNTCNVHRDDLNLGCKRDAETVHEGRPTKRVCLDLVLSIEVG
jgi:hypothetical protein